MKSKKWNEYDHQVEKMIACLSDARKALRDKDTVEAELAILEFIELREQTLYVSKDASCFRMIAEMIRISHDQGR